MNLDSEFLPPPPPEDDETPEEKREYCSMPGYMESVYPHIYSSKLLTSLFNEDHVANALKYFQLNTLIRRVVKYVQPNTDILQMGATWGPLEYCVAKKQNFRGRYHIEDISPVQYEAAKAKVAPWLNAKAKLRDFTVPTKKVRTYDTVICFFSLHEMPDERKKITIKRAINVLNLEGRAIFVDYHKPTKYHPLRFLIRQANRISEPFAESLWNTEIKNYLQFKPNIIWSKETFFGGLFQITTALKKEAILD